MCLNSFSRLIADLNNSDEIQSASQTEAQRAGSLDRNYRIQPEGLI